MNSSEHFKAAEQLLSEAAFTVSASNPTPVTRHGEYFPTGVHESMIARAHVHAVLAFETTDIEALRQRVEEIIAGEWSQCDDDCDCGLLE